MCGICGILNLNNEPIDQLILKRMTDIIFHRGPDEEGYYVDGNIGLGIRRLKIIDLTTGSQPIHNEDKTIWVVLNGEIYNFQELRKRLENEGHKFYTETDTEVLVHLYEKYGESLVKYIRGMFGFAIWDKKKQFLFLARDRLGIKPLYYALVENTLIFGSEIKSILEFPSFESELNFNALDLFLTFRYTPAPFTMFKNVYKLLPGHALTTRGGETFIRKYWNLDHISEERSMDLHHISNKLIGLLEESVRIEMVADVPLGLMLSGGLDSSSIAALMCRNSNSPIKTFTVGFNESPSKYNELADARVVADFFNTEHFELTTSFNEHSDILPSIVWHMDEPIGDLSAIGLYLITKLAKRHVTVALCGQGSDELFAGYDKHVGTKLTRYYHLIPYLFREKLLVPFAEGLPGLASLKRATISLHEEDEVQRCISMSTIFSPQMKSKLYSSDIKSCIDKDIGMNLVRSYLNEAPSSDPLSRILYLDIKMALADDLLMYFDKMSMANSIEIRVPFLDHNLVELATKTPSHLKLHFLTRKFLLKNALKKFLPQSVLKKKKVGFFHGVDAWVRSELNKGDALAILTDPKAKSRGYFDYAFIEDMLKLHGGGKQNFGREIFCLILFELWHRIFIDRDLQVNTGRNKTKAEAIKQI